MSNDETRLPVLIYDGDCHFCQMWIDYWQRLTGNRVQYAPFQEKASAYPDIPLEAFQQSSQLILPSGEVFSGAHAVFRALSYTPSRRWMLWVYEKIPGAAPVAEGFYRFISTRRDFAHKVTRFLWGDRLEPATYSFVVWTFLKALGLIYLIAFASLWAQVVGLYGSNGILPIVDFLQTVQANFGSQSYVLLPSIFWLDSSDAFLQIVCIAGVVLALLLILGFARRIVLILLYIAYLSLVGAGQVFLSFQWDVLLLEVGFLAIFLGTSSIVILLFRWLLFRLMFYSAAVKLLSGDPSWHNLTALTFHYETQPIPNPISWYAHQLPEWFQKLSAALMFFIEGIVPFFFFTPRRLRFVAAVFTLLFQVLIFTTGNYTFFNLLTMALCLFLLDDMALRRVIPDRIGVRVKQALAEPSRAGRYIPVALAALIMLVSGFQFVGVVFSTAVPAPVAEVMRTVAPFRIANTYGLFSVMTTSRPEIIIEGSNDGLTWQAYEFVYKPGALDRALPQVAPHQPRLDWHMWFAALGAPRNNPWFSNLVLRLLEGSPEVLALLGHNPFPETPPRFIRALLFDYRFAEPNSRYTDGVWWQRELLGVYFQPVSLGGN